MSSMNNPEFGLDYTTFNTDSFMNSLGKRLELAGHTDLANELIALGLSRRFLTKKLDDANRELINDQATPFVAEEAALFQDEVSRVEVNESGERMVDLQIIAQNLDLPWSFSTTPYHPACGEWAGKPRLFWVREQVGQVLVSMTAALSSVNFGLHFEDAFRPLGVQEGLFARRYTMTEKEHPTWSEAQILLETKSKTAYTPRFAAHKGGAAVDIRLYDSTAGKLVDIGHDYPDGGAIVAMDSPYVTQTQWENRYLLNSVGLMHGFAAYPFEDWHFSMLDTTAAACNKKDGKLPVAKYGPIKQFDLESGEILEVYTNAELDDVFEIISE